VTYWDGGKRFVPRRALRGTKPYDYFELSLAQGPVAIGVTGQNRLLDFIGTAWLLLLDFDMQLRLFRRGAAVDEWEEITANLPPVFNAPLPEGSRRVSFAFDQSARVIVAYQLDGVVRVTRWDATISQYVQGPDFSGVDPFVVFDAVWYQFVPQSDVLLFYLSPDRQRVLCRVQREIYSVERLIHDYGAPVVMDRVIRIPLRYEVLVSDEAGDPIEVGGDRVALVSDPYPYLGSDLLDNLNVEPGPIVQAVTQVYYAQDDDAFAGGVTIGDMAAVATRQLYVAEPEEFFGTIALGNEAIATVVRYLAVEEENQVLLGAVSIGDAVATLVRVLRFEEDGPFYGAVTLGGVVRATTV